MWKHWWPLWYSLSTQSRPSDKKDDNVTTRMTNDQNWQIGKSCVMVDVTTAQDMWQPKWRQKYNPDDPDNNGWLPWMIHVTTCQRPWKFSWWHLMTPSGDIYCRCQKLPVLQMELSDVIEKNFRIINGSSHWSSMLDPCYCQGHILVIT
jgi:hypothetical protein